MVGQYRKSATPGLILGSNSAASPTSLHAKMLADEQGVAAIEFAMTAPVFIMLVFGMITYAVFFGTVHSVQELAADAARVAVAGISDAERQQLVGDYLKKNAGGYLFIDSSKVTYFAGTSPSDANQLAVSVTYDSTRFPLWALLPANLLPDPKITRSVSIRVGGI